MLDDIAGAMSPGDSAPSSAREPNSESEDDIDAAWVAKVRPHAGAMRNGSEPLLMLRDVIDLGGICIACDVSQIPALDTLDPGTGYLGWSFAIPGEVDEATVRDVFDFVGDDCSLAIGDDTPMPPVRLPEPRAVATPAAPPAPAPAPGLPSEES